MKLLDEETYAGITRRTYLHVGDDGRDRFTVASTQPVDAILRRCRRERNEAPRPSARQGLRHVAEIPAVLVEEACRVYQIPFAELMLAKTDKAQRVWRTLLNARELSGFRTAPGRVDLERR